MDTNVYKSIEITGASTESIEHAIQTAISRAGKSVRGMCWFEVTSMRGDIGDNSAIHYQVTVKIGFKLDD